MQLTTTLAMIRAKSPCSSGWAKLVNHLGGLDKYGADTPINLLTILDSNGVQDMLWCLRATAEDSKRVTSQLAIEFAAEVLPIYEARYPNNAGPRNCIRGCRDFLDGKITREELNALRKAAYAYAADAAAAATYAAAYAADAAAAATYAAAYAADAAAAADARAKALDRQAEIIRTILS